VIDAIMNRLSSDDRRLPFRLLSLGYDGPRRGLFPLEGPGRSESSIPPETGGKRIMESRTNSPRRVRPGRDAHTEPSRLHRGAQRNVSIEPRPWTETVQPTRVARDGGHAGTGPLMP